MRPDEMTMHLHNLRGNVRGLANQLRWLKNNCEDWIFATEHEYDVTNEDHIVCDMCKHAATLCDKIYDRLTAALAAIDKMNYSCIHEARERSLLERPLRIFKFDGNNEIEEVSIEEAAKKAGLTVPEYIKESISETETHLPPTKPKTEE